MSVSQAVVSLSAQQAQVLGLVLPHLAGTAVDRAEISGDLVRIWVRAVAGGAACPGCGTWCTEVRDRYARRLRDAAAGGRRVLIWLVVRLLRCGNAECPRASFAEQPQGLAVPYARGTPLLAGQLARGGGGAGRAGRVPAGPGGAGGGGQPAYAGPGPDGAARSRPPGWCGCWASMTSRCARAATTRRCWWTWRPASRWTCCRTGRRATAEEWLRAHPEVEVICRDRGGAYAEAARAAPRARSRWPTGGTCGTTCASTPARPSPATRSAWPGRGCAGRRTAAGRPAAAAGAGAGSRSREAGCPPGLEAVIRERHAAVHELRAAGKTQAEAAAALGLSRQLTGRFWRAASADALLKTRGASALDPWKPYLRAAVGPGHHQDRGPAPGDHRAGLRRQRAHHLRLAGPAQARRPAQAARPARGNGRSPAWMLTDPARLGEDEQAQLAAVLRPLPRTARPGRARHRIRQDPHRPRHGGRLDAWLAAAGASPGQPELALLHQRHPPRLPRRPQRPDPALELRPGRRPQHPHQAPQTPDVRTRSLPAPPQAHPPDQLKTRPVTNPKYATEPPARLVSGMRGSASARSGWTIRSPARRCPPRRE